MTTAYDGVPDALLALVPELASLPLPEERTADCARCVMLVENGRPSADPSAFHPSTKCCTYHPQLPNFLAGRALRAGGVARDKVRARLLVPDGLEPAGILPPAPWRTAYEASREVTFGRDPALRCPFYVDGDLSCGIWEHRNSVCRSWFCRTDAGYPTQRLWRAASDALSRAEFDLADAVATLGRAPGRDAPPAAWERWYRFCADAVDHARPDAVARVASPRLAELRQRLKEAAAAVEDPLPDVVIPSIRAARPDGDGVYLAGYSLFDDVRVDARIFAWLSRLDGHTTWSDAAEALPDGLVVDHDVVAELFRVRAVRAPSDGDAAADGDADPHAFGSDPGFQ